jgi:hypothetical protein
MNNVNKVMGDMYDKIRLTESEKNSEVKNKIKAGDGFEGSEKAKTFSKDSGPEQAANIKKPVEGPSSGDDAVEKGKGKVLAKKTVSTKDSVEQPKLSLSFDDVYKKIVQEEESLDAVMPAQDIEGEGFDETKGDFEKEETDVNEEVDVGTELRLIAERLMEMAEKLGGEEMSPMDDESVEGAEGMEDAEGSEMGTSPVDSLNRESVQTEAIKNEPNPKPLKKTSFNPKMKQNPKNIIGKSGAGKASLPAKKDHSGVPSNAPKTQFGPKMSQNPTGTGPAVKGNREPLIA